MRRSRVTLLGMCLLLSGFSPCVRELVNDAGRGVQTYAASKGEADRRADELQKECDALKDRTISFEEEHAFGGAVSVNWVSQGGGLTDKPDARRLHEQLNKLGKNLAAQSSRPDLPWTFGVLRSEGFNAVSGPGGYVFVSEGLLARLDNEAQLAGVLAHEIAHVTGKHAVREYHDYLVDQCEVSVGIERSSAAGEALAEVASRQTQRAVGRGAQGLAQHLPSGELRAVFSSMASQVKRFDFNAAGKAFIRSVTEGVIQRLAEKGFREEDELDADVEAVELMAAAGYAPEEYVGFLSKLPDRGLSTAHPRKQERQQRLRKHLDELRGHASDTDFTTPVDLSQTKVVPLRDVLQTRRTGTATRGN